MAGLAKDKTPLISVVNKGLDSISDTERNNIMMNYTILNPYRQSLQDTLYLYRWPLLVIASLLTLIIAATFVVLSTRKKSSLKLEAAYEQTKNALTQAEKARCEAETATANALATTERLLNQINLTRQYIEEAETDSLTGLLNRRGGEKRIRALLENGETGLLCLFDIDLFKKINDTFGHETGDEALKAVAMCMRTFRDNDVQVRYGGDEFLVYALGISTKDQAFACADRFINTLHSMVVPGMEGHTLTVSIGMHLCTKESDMDYTSLIKRTDEIMYQCKRNEQIHYALD